MRLWLLLLLLLLLLLQLLLLLLLLLLDHFCPLVVVGRWNVCSSRCKLLAAGCEW